MPQTKNEVMKEMLESKNKSNELSNNAKEHRIELVKDKIDSVNQVEESKVFPSGKSGNVASKWALAHSRKPAAVQRRLAKRTQYT